MVLHTVHFFVGPPLAKPPKLSAIVRVDIPRFNHLYIYIHVFQQETEAFYHLRYITFRKKRFWDTTASLPGAKWLKDEYVTRAALLGEMRTYTYEIGVIHVCP